MNAHQMFHLMVTEYFPYLKNNGRHCEHCLKKEKDPRKSDLCPVV